MKIRQLIAFLTLITTPAFAIDFSGIVTPETLVQHRAALSLTAEQETTLTGIYEGAKTEAAPLEEAVRTEEAKLGELLRGADLTDAAAAAQLQLLLEA